MNLTGLLALFLLPYCVNGNTPRPNQRSKFLARLVNISNPASSDKFFVATVASILLANHQTDHFPTLISATFENELITDVVGDVLRTLQGRLVLRLDQFSESKQVHYALFFDGYFSFRKILQNLRVENDPILGKCLLIYSGAKLDDKLRRRIFGDLWKSRSVDVDLVWSNNSRVEVWTFFPYAKPYCGSVKPVLLRSYLPNDTESHLHLFPSKTTSFKGCPLKVGAFQASPFMILDEEAPDGISGFEGDLLKLLAEKLQFKISIVEPPNGTLWGLADAENSTGMMRLILDEEVEFGISGIGIASVRNDILKPGVAHHVSEMVIAVPAGRAFTAFEKLFSPLEMESWLMLVAFYLVAVIAITVIQFSSLTIQEFVYGRGVGTPYLNLFRVFVGCDMHRTPKRNFARFILILWMWYNLVLRSIYVGSLFRCLQNSYSYAPMSTLQEIQESNALFFAVEWSVRFLDNFPQILPRVRLLSLVTDTMLRHIGWMSEQRSFSDVALITSDYVARHNKLYGRKGRFVPIARETVATFAAAIYYPKRSILTKSFDDEIQRIQAAGLIEIWVRQYGDYDFFPRENHSKAPQALSHEHLLGLFQVYRALTLGSVVVFLAEIVGQKIKRLRRMFERKTVECNELQCPNLPG